MSLRQRIVKFVVSLAIMMTVYILLSPVPKNYENMSYANFKAVIDEKDVDGVTYFELNKYAIIHRISDNKEYKVPVVSSENFKNDIYEYSLIQKEFMYSVDTEPIPINFLGKFFIMMFVCIGISIVWKSAYMAISLKKLDKLSKDKSKKAERDALSASLFKGLLPQSTVRRVENCETTFKDVIGLDKQIEELMDVVDFLKEPEKYEEMGATLPRGVLLHGKPGVGKTHIAMAIAGEAKVPFFEISASELQAKYLGESEERIRNLFDEAKKVEPSIIYIDEIDSIAVQRFSEDSNKYAASIVNQLLACMDGFSKDNKVIVIASTNHISALDSALLRSGRFDRKIYIHEPDRKARRELFEYYSKGKLIDDTINLEKFLDFTSGLTGADIKTILNEAAILAVRAKQDFVTEEILMEAFRKVEIGSKNSFEKQSGKVMYRTAVHEAGHTIVSHHFGQKVTEISIVSRGDAAGYNLYANKDIMNYSFKEMKQRIMCLLAGRAAEEIIYKDSSAGASDDLRRASSIIKDMYLRFSMQDEQTISLVFTDDSRFNEMVAKNSFRKMDVFLKNCYGETIEIIKLREDVLKKLADTLFKKETLSSSEIETILKEG